MLFTETRAELPRSRFWDYLRVGDDAAKWSRGPAHLSGVIVQHDENLRSSPCPLPTFPQSLEFDLTLSSLSCCCGKIAGQTHPRSRHQLIRHQRRLR
jgi:hypothetical protein